MQAANSLRTATLYYGPSSGIGLLLNHHPNYAATGPEQRHLRMGVIGLGVGTLATYGHPDDHIRFYEMNPDVVRFAAGSGALFSFVKDSPASLDVVLGDARISLERELASGSPGKFDVLVVDAFSGDSIPVHLLTSEAMSVYLRHLRNAQSVIAFHISNRNIDLLPVVVGLAQQYQLQVERILAKNPQGEAELPSYWVLTAADPAILNIPALATRAAPLRLASPPRLWTDDYSNLFDVLR
ncbi:MAG: hypothetical protein JOZ80_13395 [Acidobacteriaceae bacterium]|nr:hypothetical protein [Acidobacteriaceae bacterium]